MVSFNAISDYQQTLIKAVTKFNYGKKNKQKITLWFVH